MDFVAEMLKKHLDIVVATEFGKAFATIITIVVIVALLMLIVNIIQKLIFKIYVNNSSEKVQKAVTDIIYHLDHFADHMSNKQKRKEAINNVKDLFIWRAIPIPSFIIGIIIDLEVASIRKLQKGVEKYKDPYLHPDEESDVDEDAAEKK